MSMVSNHCKYDEDGFQTLLIWWVWFPIPINMMRMVSKHYKYDEDGLNENVNMVSARLLFRVWKLSINRRFLKQEGLINQSINQSWMDKMHEI